MQYLIVNLKTGYQAMVHNPVRVDRGTPWGNPFILGVDGDRAEVCRLFEAYATWRLCLQSHWLDHLRARDLACWCAPEQCHAETLMRLANR